MGAGWAARRALTPVALTGVVLALAACAAVWFSAGQPAASAIGAAVLACAVLAGAVASQLSGGERYARGTYWMLDAPRLVPAGRLAGEVLVLAGLAAGAGAAARAGASGGLAGAGVPGGAAGGGALAGGGWPSPWLAAVAVLALLSVRDTMRACGRGRDAAGAGQAGHEAGQAARRAAGRAASHGAGGGRDSSGAAGLLARAALTMPSAGQLALIAVTAIGWGPRIALLALLGWSGLAVCAGLVLFAPRRGQAAGPPLPRPRRPPEPAAGGLADLLGPPAPVPPAPVLPVPAARPAPDWPGPAESPGTHEWDEPDRCGPAPRDEATRWDEPAQWDEPEEQPEPIGAEPIGPGAPGTAAAHPPEVIAACRDDGPAARWLGRLVRGNLMPLPPAVTGVAAAALLAALGLRGLPGLIMLTPPVVLILLAGPGSSHPHDGRSDWLVPAILCGGQYIYLVAVGFAAFVPGPVVLALVAACALGQADRVRGGAADDRAARPLGAGMGWEGRMLIVGLGAAFGIAALASLGLTAYLLGLLGWKLGGSGPQPRLAWAEQDS